MLFIDQFAVLFCAFQCIQWLGASPLDLAVKLEKLLLDPDLDAQSNLVDKDGQSNGIVYFPSKINIRSSEELFTSSEEFFKSKHISSRSKASNGTENTTVASSTHQMVTSNGTLSMLIKTIWQSIADMMGMRAAKENTQDTY